MRKIVVGTRKSKLALIQTNWVIEQLKKAGIRNQFEIKEFSTKGDRNLNVALSKVGGSGVFSKEIQEAIYDKVIDFAVHSLKDVPATLTGGLVIASIPVREDHRDAYIAKSDIKLHDLPAGAIIGTSSLRRSAQILAARPDVKTNWIRGTVGSRLNQLDEGKFDAIILAVAGIKRLGLSEDIITEYLSSDIFVPAVGQGALAIECREDDHELRSILAKINDTDTEKSVLAERRFANLLDDTDQTPIGCYAYVDNNEITLHASVATVDGKTVLTTTISGTEPNQVAEEVVESLVDQGARKIINSFKEEPSE